jgi:hypothetical protein
MTIIIGNEYQIINSACGHNGKIVTVTGYGGVGPLDDCSLDDGDRWYIDDQIASTWGDLINHVGEKQLRPYYDGNETISWEAMRDIWTPESVEA